MEFIPHEIVCGICLSWSLKDKSVRTELHCLVPQTSRGDIWDKVIKPKQNLLLSGRNKEVKNGTKINFRQGLKIEKSRKKNTVFHHLDSFKKSCVFLKY